MLPMPRDLKEPEGWRFSSLSQMLLVCYLAILSFTFLGFVLIIFVFFYVVS